MTNNSLAADWLSAAWSGAFARISHVFLRPNFRNSQQRPLIAWHSDLHKCTTCADEYRQMPVRFTLSYRRNSPQPSDLLTRIAALARALLLLLLLPSSSRQLSEADADVLTAAKSSTGRPSQAQVFSSTVHPPSPACPPVQ